MTQPDNLADAGLRITAVAELCGLSVHTIRAWERRYGVPRPPRSAGRQRLYSRSDVEALRRMHELSQSGVPLANAAQTVLREQEAATAANNGASGATAAALPPLQSFIAALLAFDESRAAGYWTTYLAGGSLDSLLDNVVVPTLQHIGDAWHAGDVSVAQEHFSSAFIRARLDALARQHDPPAGAPSVVLACLPGNWHEISILILHLVLRYRGLRTVYLGQSVPLDDIVRTTVELRPTILVLHGYGEDANADTRTLVKQLASKSPTTHVVYGGRSFDDDPTARIEGATYGGATLADGADTIEAKARQSR